MVDCSVLPPSDEHSVRTAVLLSLMMSAIPSGSGEGSGEKGNLEEHKKKESVKRATHIGKKLNKYTMEDKESMI